MLKFNPLWSPKPPVILTYGVAVLSVIAALIILWRMETDLQSAAHVSLFLCAIIFSVWFGGVGPGLFAIALSLLAFDYYFLPPIYSLAVEITQLPRLLLLALLALFTVSLTATLRSETESLKQTHDDLKRNNKVLQAEIVERKRLEDELRRSEASLGSAQRIAHIGSWDWDIQNDQIFVSEEFYRIIGVTKEAFGGNFEAVFSAVHPDDRAIVKAAVDVALANVAPFNMVHRVLRPSGEVRIVRAIEEVTFDESGKPLRMSGTVQDITERKLAEEALRESEYDLAEAQRLARLGSWSLDIATNTVRWSEELYRIFDVEKTALGGTYETFLSRVHPDDRNRVLQINADARSSGEPFEVEYRITTRSDRLKHIREVGYARKNTAGVVSGLFGTAQDITERKRAEEELRKSGEQLRTLAAYLQSVREEERTRIARELHDEIGQALTGIKLALETSMRGNTSNVRRELTQALAATSELIGRVRNLSLELRPAMLDDLGLLAALKWHFDRYTTQVKIKVDFKHTGLEGQRFAQEIETAAYRIVQEALTNVARHADVDQVEVNVAADKSAVRIRIKDSGTGFDPDSPPGITGGLSGMRERAIMSGGKFKVESAPGAGTLLTAELPLRLQ